MTLERVLRWIQTIPERDRNLPIIEYNGRMWTPNEILNQISTQPYTVLSQNLQKLLEAKAFGPTANIEALAKERLMRILQTGPPFRMHTLTAIGPKEITSQQLLNEVIQETALGKSFIQAEAARMKILLSKF
jgi:hypothetical protein